MLSTPEEKRKRVRELQQIISRLRNLLEGKLGGTWHSRAPNELLERPRVREESEQLMLEAQREMGRLQRDLNPHGSRKAQRHAPKTTVALADRDPNYRLKKGPHKGEKISKVPIEYLAAVTKDIAIPLPLRKRAQTEIHRRCLEG